MTLADRISVVLELQAPLTSEEIARELHVRPFSVREALHSDSRFVSVRLPARRRNAIGWMLGAEPPRARDGQGRANLSLVESSAAVGELAESGSAAPSSGEPKRAALAHLTSTKGAA